MRPKVFSLDLRGAGSSKKVKTEAGEEGSTSQRRKNMSEKSLKKSKLQPLNLNLGQQRLPRIENKLDICLKGSSQQFQKLRVRTEKAEEPGRGSFRQLQPRPGF